MNIEKKLKRKKDAELIETFSEDYTEDDLKRELTKYNTVKNDLSEDDIILYRFKNIITGESISSIYSNLNNIPNINKNEWNIL